MTDRAIRRDSSSLVFLFLETSWRRSPSQGGKVLASCVNPDPSGIAQPTTLGSTGLRTCVDHPPPICFPEQTFNGLDLRRSSHGTEHGPLCERQEKQARRLRLPHLLYRATKDEAASAALHPISTDLIRRENSNGLTFHMFVGLPSHVSSRECISGPSSGTGGNFANQTC